MEKPQREVNRRKLIKYGGLATCATFALTARDAFASPPTAANYFVSAVGNDGAEGINPSSAWATIDKANGSMLPAGSTLLFRRGDTFYGELNLPSGVDVGAYGEGPKPILTMFKVLDIVEAWNETAPGIWRINLGSPTTHGGYHALADANIGYLSVDGQVKANLKFDRSQLKDQWDFYGDVASQSLFVRSRVNPTALATRILAAPNGKSGRIILCNKGTNNIQDVHLTGTGACAIGGGASNVSVRNCLIDYIGGAALQDGTLRRYGNGIDIWVNTDTWLVEGNEIAQVYDAAWSPQGIARDDGYWRNISVLNNHIHHCSQSLEFWATGSQKAPGFERVIFRGNRCENAGASFFSDVRPDQQVRVHLLTYNLDTPVDITIEHNSFDGVFGSFSYHAFPPPPGLISRDNEIGLRAGQKIQAQLPDTIEQAEAWRSLTGRERGSVFRVLR